MMQPSVMPFHALPGDSRIKVLGAVVGLCHSFFCHVMIIVGQPNASLRAFKSPLERQRSIAHLSDIGNSCLTVSYNWWFTPLAGEEDCLLHIGLKLNIYLVICGFVWLSFLMCCFCQFRLPVARLFHVPLSAYALPVLRQEP